MSSCFSENHNCITANYVGSMKTLIELFEKSVEKYPNNVLLWEKTKDQYEGTTYSETLEKVLQFSAGLRELGLKQGDRVALLSEGQNAWLISELAVLYAGGINVPLSIKLDAANDLRFRLEHSGAKMVIVSRNQKPKIFQIADQLTALETIIVVDDAEEETSGKLRLSTVVERGVQALQNTDKRDELHSIKNNIKPDDLANISYTSGTTADPKGIMLSHLNYTANVIQANSLMTIAEDYKTLAILPWDHSFAHTACLYSFMVNGASVGSVQIGKTGMETLKNVPVNIKELKPDVLMSVPALAKNFRKNIESNIQKQGKSASKLFNIALKNAYFYNGEGWNRGKGARMLGKPLNSLFDKILFSKIREGFGGDLKFFIGGGALLDIELQRFFYAIGIPMCQGYGLSEAAPVISSNALHAIKFGSSGKVVDFLDIKILDENNQELPVGQKGEIVIKGDNVMLGYWQNDKATKEVLRDGWLHTGDMGYLDKDGFLYVLGRFKSLLISNDGEKFSPEGIEEAITDNSPYIDQILLYNNQNPYTVGLVVPNIAALNKAVKEQKLELKDHDGQTAALEILNNEVKAYLSGGKYSGMFPEFWIPSALSILPEGFTEDNKLLNSTMKVVRSKAFDYFSKELETLYICTLIFRESSLAQLVRASDC